MFSPMVATADEIASATVSLPSFAALMASTSAPTFSATSAIVFTRFWNCSLRATKSISELTSTTTPLVGPTATAIRPSAATRPAFFAALARPFLRSRSTAASMLPPVSVSALLQSSMPAPVRSRSSFTIAEVISAVENFLVCSDRCARDGGPHRLRRLDRCGPAQGDAVRRKLLRLRDPPFDATGKSHFFADLVGVLRHQLGDLRVVEDAEIVEALLDGARHASELAQIVSGAARAR